MKHKSKISTAPLGVGLILLLVFTLASPAAAQKLAELPQTEAATQVRSQQADAATEIAGPMPEQSILEVLRDKESGLLSIRARKVSLGKVMERISEVTGLIVKSTNPDILEELVEINLGHQSLEQIIDVLLDGVNSILFYSSAPATAKAMKTPGLFKVMLLSREVGGSAGIKTNQKEAPEKTKVQKVQIVMNTELGHAILGNNTFATQTILRALIETGTEKKIERAIEDLGTTLFNPSLYNQASNGHVFYEALAALKELDPDHGEDFLTGLLETSEEAWVQSLAATSLGEIGREWAIDPLLSAFAGNDPLVRDAAAHSLARIGDDRGIHQLLQAMKNGDPALQQVIVNALAFAGDENSKAALNQAIAEKQIPAEAVSGDVIYQLAQQNEPE